ncbi:MAG: T9SS type A sorting domain-containing protein [bacterium]
MKYFIYLFCFIALAISSYSQIIINHVEHSIPIFDINEAVLLDNQTNLTGGSQISGFEVGNEKMFWRWNLTVMPPTWVQENALCVAVGERAYIFVAYDQVDINFFQADIDTIMQYLEHKTFATDTMGILETVVNNFGDFPDELDNDPKVIIYYTGLKSYKGSVFNGYFSIYNQLTESEAVANNAHSNECEMVYMTCDPLRPAERNNISVLAHELQHLIHWSKDQDEEQWINEGCSEYAMVLCGLPDVIQDFQNNPDISLVTWNKKYTDQIKSMLFITYLAEQFGGAEFIRELIANPFNGVEGVTSALNSTGIGMDFKDLYTDWALANFIDDTTFEDGQYGYKTFDIPNMKIQQKFLNYPVTSNNKLSSFGTRYYELPTDFAKINLSFNLPFGTNWSTSLIAYEGSTVKELMKSTDGNLSFSQPENYDLSKLVLAVSRTDNNIDSVAYSFEALNVTGIEDKISSNNIHLRVYPNPVQDEAIIAYDMNQPGNVRITLVDLLGREIKELRNSFDNNGNHIIQCDISVLQSGTYFVKITNANQVLTQKLIKY